jgi:Flp pilus assembly protein TadD
MLRNRTHARIAALMLSVSALCACSSTPDGAAAGTMGGAISAASVDSNLSKVQSLRAGGDYAGAVKILSQLLLVSPDNARVIGEYGKVLAEQGRAREAVEFLTRATMLSPEDWALHSALGVAYDETGDYAKARIAYEAALKLKPGEASALNNYAMSRMMAGDAPMAKNLIHQAAAASRDLKIARNLAMIDELAAHAPAQMPAPVAAAAPKPVEPAAPRPAIAQAPLPAVRTVTAAPVPVTPPLAATAAAKPRAKSAAEANSEPQKKSSVPSLRLASQTQ